MIIYLFLIIIMLVFKVGNVAVFKFDINIDFNFDNFKGFFIEILYGIWYFNILIIVLIIMVV